MPPKKTKKTTKKETPKKASGKKEAPNKEEVKPAEKAEVVSKKKVVYAEIDDEVTDIYDKLASVRAKRVYIVLPKRAILFQSIVNIKILKRKADETDKTIYFITNDKNGIHLAAQVGIEVFNKASGKGPALFSTDVDDEKLRITPLRATVNSVDEAAPTRLAERKLSISEILRRKKSKKTVDISEIQNPPKKTKKKSKFVVVAPNRQALIGLTVVSIFILLVIVYIALPGVTIFLTPSASVLEKSVNITLADFQTNKVELETRPPHMVASYPIDTTVTKTITHFSTGKKFSNKGVNASGKITVINTTANVWPLVEKTRFQTEDGIVFRITQPVSVPAATSTDFGKLEVVVVADQLDAFEIIVGERGNIEASRFFLPGLRGDSQSELYAESFESMTGGITDYVTYISAEDVEAAKSRLNDELIKAAVEGLELAVDEKTNLVANSTVYSLLDGDGAVQMGDVSMTVPGDLEGQTRSEFEISGEVYVSGVYYEHDTMLDILKSELMLKKSPQKELLRINEDSTSYRIFEWDDYLGKIKLTANIKGIEQFSIDPSLESGEKLLTKIKDHIAGKDIDDAKLYIQNLPQINKVEIDSWPVWSPTIPNIPENIEFEIRDAITVE